MPRPVIKSIKNPVYYYDPFKTQCKGFNTEFSLNDCRIKEARGTLTIEERAYVDYIKSRGTWYRQEGDI